MRITLEVWLVIGIYFFYLIDSAKLLFHNQLILYSGYSGWKIICPNARWQILRKIPYVFNPFSPNIPVFYGTWSMMTEANDTEGTEAIDKFIEGIYPLNYFVMILFTLMCVFMPLVIFSHGLGLIFLVIAIFTYAVILVMLTVLFTKRFKLGLSSKNYFGIVFDCIACPPFAINLIRKITWQYKINPGLVEFSIKKLSKDNFSPLRQLLLSKLDEQLLREDNTFKQEQLKNYKHKFLELSK